MLFSAALLLQRDRHSSFTGKHKRNWQLRENNLPEIFFHLKTHFGLRLHVEMVEEKTRLVTASGQGQ